MAGFEIFPELEGYANIAKKKARDGDFWQALEIWQEVGRGVQSRRQQEKDRQQRQSELDAAAKQREKDKADAETAKYDEKIADRDMKYADEQAKRAQERKDADDLKAKNAPIVATVKQKAREAIQSKDRGAWLDFMDNFSDLDEDVQKRIPIDVYKAEFQKVMEPPKPDPNVDPPHIRAIKDDLISTADEIIATLTDPNDIFSLKMAKYMIETGEATKEAAAIIRGYQEEQAGGGKEVPPSMRSPLTQGERTEASEFDYESRTADMTEAGSGLSNAYELFGITEVPELNEQFFEPFISPDAKRRKYEFYVSKYATEALSDGTFDDIEDKSERRSAAKRYGIEKVQELFGKPVRGVDRVIDNTPNVESSASIEKTEDEIRRRFPRLNEALQDSTFREALDAEYGEGWSEYFSDSQSTETPESLLEY